MTRTIALSVLMPGFAVLLAACGGAAPAASSPPAPRAASAPAKPSAAVSAAASPAASAAASGSAAAKPNAAASASASGLAAVAQRWIDVINKGDVAGLAALFTDDAVFAGGPPCTVKTPCVGPAGITKRVQNAVASHTQQALVGPPAVVGNIVQWRHETRNDASKAAGVDRQVSLTTVTLRGDKIATFIDVTDLSDAQTAKARLYTQQQAAASAAAKPAAARAASAVTDPKLM